MWKLRARVRGSRQVLVLAVFATLLIVGVNVVLAQSSEEVAANNPLAIQVRLTPKPTSH